jgi:hypothetical protein
LSAGIDDMGRRDEATFAAHEACAAGPTRRGRGAHLLQRPGLQGAHAAQFALLIAPYEIYETVWWRRAA